MPATLPALVLLAALQSGSDDAARTVDALFACRTIAADAERLACFNRAAAAVQSARDKKEIVIVDKAEVRKAKRGLFGFAIPKIKLFGDGEKDAEPELKELDAKVVSAGRYGTGLAQVTLEDGSVWRFTEPLFTEPKAGDTIHIERGALGSYMGSVKGKRGARIRRER